MGAMRVFSTVLACGAFSAAMLALSVGLLLNGTLRDLGLTRRLDRIQDWDGKRRITGDFPVLLSEPWGFDFERIPNLTGRVVVVTGANSGLGYLSALHLARHGASVVMACRSMNKCEAAAHSVTSNLTAAAPFAGGAAEAMRLDLSSMASVREFAAAVLAARPRLDQLMLNGGMMASDFALGVDGIESVWATNHVGNQLLFTLLEPLLVRTAKTSPVTVTVLSSGHTHYEVKEGGLPLSLAHVNSEPDFEPLGRYAESKLANILFAMEAQRRHADESIFVNSLHPGVVDSNFLRPDLVERVPLLKWAKPVVQRLSWRPEEAVLTQLFCSCSPEIAANNIRGRYFHPIAVQNEPSPMATAENAERLWTFTEELIRDRLPAPRQSQQWGEASA